MAYLSCIREISLLTGGVDYNVRSNL